jgi:S1-C subfamily serine protease
MKVRIFLILLILLVGCPSSLPAAPEQRVALVIGNGAYNSAPLKNPVNDAHDMAAVLKTLGFNVVLKTNVNLRSMEEAARDFGSRLKRGGIGLFYYAGHGLQVNGVNYLVPVGARIDRESDVKYESVDVGKILDEMDNAGNNLNIVILDACRDNPYTRSFRSVSRGLAIVSSAPAGTFISYSTGPGQVAGDGDGKNSPYAAALLRYMREPGQTIEQVFKNVRRQLDAETSGKQIPWELSSLKGEFYFNPGAVAERAGKAVTEAPSKDEGLTGGGPDFMDVAERVKNAVVHIAAQSQDQNKALGSGFIISHDGYILTNAHVVGLAKKIFVRFSPGKEYEGEIVGADSRTDVALVKIKSDGSLPVAALGDSDNVRVGQRVLAVGNPLGREHTVHAGRINAKFQDGFIQTDALINPGNSGGALFTTEGKVVGINTAVQDSASGIGFAAPINTAKSILRDLKDKGKVIRGWIGLSIQDVTEDRAKSLNLKDRNGVLVSDVVREGPAGRAGLRAGDLVTEVNGQSVNDARKLASMVASFRPGDRIEVKALTNGRTKTFSMIVDERKD